MAVMEMLRKLGLSGCGMAFWALWMAIRAVWTSIRHVQVPRPGLARIIHNIETKWPPNASYLLMRQM